MTAHLMTRGCATNVRSSSRFHPASSDDRDLLRSRSITRTHLHGPTQLLKIGRWIAPHEEPRSTRDRCPIVARSWPDSCTIVVHSAPMWSSGITESKVSIFNFIRGHLIKNRRHDRHSIVARSRRDRGLIVPRSGLFWKQNRG